MSNILVIGSLAYDSIFTPSGSAERTLGGSANYFSLASSFYAPVRVVGVVGSDYSDGDMQMLRERKVDVSGIQVLKGKTFHWAGEYKTDLNEAVTLSTELNVFEHFNPQLPANFRNSEYVFLANIDPVLQHQVLEQVQSPKLL
jgi:pfkB family carbohydrate kinase